MLLGSLPSFGCSPSADNAESSTSATDVRSHDTSHDTSDGHTSPRDAVVRDAVDAVLGDTDSDSGTDTRDANRPVDGDATTEDATDASDASESFDSTLPDASDAASDAHDVSDADQTHDTSDGFDRRPTDTTRKDTDREDRPGKDAGYVCPPNRKFHGRCASPIYCCRNQSLGLACQYPSTCELPSVLEQDPEWNCQPDLCNQGNP